MLVRFCWCKSVWNQILSLFVNPCVASSCHDSWFFSIGRIAFGSTFQSIELIEIGGLLSIIFRQRGAACSIYQTFSNSSMIYKKSLLFHLYDSIVDYNLIGFPTESIFYGNIFISIIYSLFSQCIILGSFRQLAHLHLISCICVLITIDVKSCR